MHDTKEMREAADYLDSITLPTTARQIREYADILDRAAAPTPEQNTPNPSEAREIAKEINEHLNFIPIPTGERHQNWVRKSVQLLRKAISLLTRPTSTPPDAGELWNAPVGTGEYSVWMTGQKFDNLPRYLTGYQLKKLVQADPTYQLYKENAPDVEDSRVSDSTTFDLSGEIQHFYAVPPATY